MFALSSMFQPISDNENKKENSKTPKSKTTFIHQLFFNWKSAKSLPYDFSKVNLLLNIVFVVENCFLLHYKKNHQISLLKLRDLSADKTFFKCAWRQKESNFIHKNTKCFYSKTKHLVLKNIFFFLILFGMNLQLFKTHIDEKTKLVLEMIFKHRMLIKFSN